MSKTILLSACTSIFANTIINITVGLFLWMNVLGMMLCKIPVNDKTVMFVVVEAILYLVTRYIVDKTADIINGKGSH